MISSRTLRAQSERRYLQATADLYSSIPSLQPALHVPKPTAPTRVSMKRAAIHNGVEICKGDYVGVR